MFYKFCAFLIVTGFSCFSCLADVLPQVVTSEVFYNYDDQVQTENVDSGNYVASRQIAVEQPRNVPVWPMAGTDADYKIACKDQDCSTGGELKIVSKIGSGLVIENNINTTGTGWSGGPSIINERPIPTGFDYECVNNAEMPLLQREMMEDNGGNVLSMSRSARRVCNKKGDSYVAFAERSGFAPDTTMPNQQPKMDAYGNMVAGTVATGGEDVDSMDAIMIGEQMNEFVDAEPSSVIKNEVRSWVVASGQTLREVLQAWCDKEGWDLVWNTAREYPIEASAVFKGRFIDVASALVRNFERALPAPYARFYKGNRVLVVSSVEE